MIGRLAMGFGLWALASVAGAAPVVQSIDQAWAQDGAEYARRFGVSEAAAVQRLRALHVSAAVTDQLRQTFASRWVGAFIEHRPELRIVVRLAGEAPVTATEVSVAGMTIPIEFRPGAPYSATTVLRAMIERQPQLDAMIPRARGRGLDPRTGDLVILLAIADANRGDLDELKSKAEALTGVRVRFERLNGEVVDQAEVAVSLGGGRVVGTDPADGKRYACTTAFAVTDGARSGVATAAHCPDTVEFFPPGGTRVSLGFVGQWGVSTQDVQIHTAPTTPPPLFQTAPAAATLRPLLGSRSRMSTRGGEWLCRQGESSGYSCAEVEMIHFAPPTPLCAGPCAPTWVTMRTDNCRSGDSGGPVFSGPIAFGIHKGGSGTGGRCNFTFYMSTDFLPEGWRLVM